MKFGEKKLFNFAFFTDVWVCCKNVKKKKKNSEEDFNSIIWVKADVLLMYTTTTLVCYTYTRNVQW